MSHFFKLVFLIASLWLFLSESQAAQEKSVKNKLVGCFAEPLSINIKNSVLNNLSKKVQFTNSVNPTFSLQQRMKELKIKAVSIAVIKNNRIDWSASLGVKFVGANSTVDCNTLFQAASISKPVAMMSILRMAEKEVINLDLDIQDYLTSFSLPKGKQTPTHPVTFRNVLNHTSGITPGGYMGYAQNVSRPSDLDIVTGNAPTNSPAIEVSSLPGTYLRYSGGAYTLAEIALQDVFEKGFESIMNEWVLKPINMKTADFSQPIDTSIHQSIAHGHYSDGSQVAGGWNIYPEQAAAGLWSNASDLARFLIEIGKGYRGESLVFPKDVVNELLSERIDNHFYGFLAQGENENLAIVHYGGNVGYRAAMVLNLASGDGAVILSNSDNGALLIDEILISMSSQYKWPHFKAINATITNINKEQLIPLTGIYVFEKQGWQVEVKYKENINALVIVFPNNDEYPITPTAHPHNHFIHPDTGVMAQFSVKNGKSEIQLYGQIGSKI